MAVKVRELKLSDNDKLTDYYFRFYDEVKDDPQFGLTLFDKRPSRLEEMSWFVGFQKACAQGDAIGLVAVADGEIVGFCEVERRKPKSPVSHRGDLGISVRKEYRGRGVGALLLKEIIGKCRGRFEILELGVFAGNHAAKHLYEKFGFKAYGLHPFAVKRNGRHIGEESMYLRL